MDINAALKKKKEEEAHQIWTGIRPSARLCRTCKFACPSTKYVNGYEKANCLVFTDEDKPMDILWEGADCEFYVKEE